MKFELTGDPNHPYQVIFGGDEVRMVQAAYLEAISRRVKMGNVGSFSTFEANLSRWHDRETATALLQDYISVAETLEEFAQRTEEEMITIAGETTVPDFMKSHLITRQRLGEGAVSLAQQIRQEGDRFSGPLPEPDSVNIDSAISNLLDESSEDL